VYVENGVIGEIREGYAGESAGAIRLDAQGKLLTPGLIDLHTDAMDVEIVPRRGADFPVAVAFRELERRMSGCGITTVYHSLHLGYRVAELQSNSRYPRREVFEKVFEASVQPTLIRNKIHLRFEVTGVEAYDTAFDLLQKGCISLLSVMDHTPGQGQTKEEGFLAMLMRHGVSRGEALRSLREKQAQPRISSGQLREMIAVAHSLNVPVASHDDDTIEKVNAMYEAGVRISEFPVALAAAVHAKSLGMAVIAGSSNVLRGGSLSGNLNVLEGIRASAIDSLCSDYYPPSLLHSVVKLAREEVLPLHEAFNLATLHPALAAGIADDTGSIETGKQADLLLLDLSAGHPLVTHTLVNGYVVAQANLQPQTVCA
jgi:alpha-D-ribose 1-methylphosphonate 5-triphosphate diphosphatase